MKIANFFNDFIADYNKAKDYQQAFDNLCKVNHNPIQDFLNDKINFKDLVKECSNVK